MDKRDLEKIVKDANWKKLHREIRKESDARIRSTIDRLIDVFAELRINDLPLRHKTEVIGKNWLTLYPLEIYLLILFRNGEYIESTCISKTHHIKRYVQQLEQTITDDEVEEVKSTLYRDGVWIKGNIEIRLEYKKILSK